MASPYVAYVDTRRLSNVLEHPWPSLPSSYQKTPLVLATVGVVLIATGVLRIGSAPLASVAMIAGGLALVAPALAARSTPASSATGATYHGTAGSVGSASEKFGDSAAIGARGERQTAELLDLLKDKVPGLHIFHGVRFPGSKNADIDHVLVYGDRVMLVDSKLFGAGQYGMSRHHDTTASYTDWWIFKDGRPWKPSAMPNAASAMRAALGSGVKVRSVLVIHGKDARVAPGQKDCYRPEQFMSEAVYDFLRSASTPTPKPSVLRHLESQLIR